jgi:hypothetical protein
LGVLTRIFYRGNGGGQVTGIVHDVEYAKYINAVNSRTLNKLTHYVIGMKYR